MTRTGSTLLFLLLVAPAGASAQERVHRFDRASASGSQPPESVAFFDFSRSRMAVAKWSTLALSGAVGAYGFFANNDAEDRYASLEEACAQDIVRCRNRLADGRFADADLERQYQDVVRLDRRARVALIASQVGIATSVVLFILDLREGEAPPNIPYEPELSVRADGAYEIRGRLTF